MTLIIGIRCQDGIVMAADSMVTEGAPIGGAAITKHEGEKLVIQGSFLWGASGQQGIKQLVEEELEKKAKQIYGEHKPPAQLRGEILTTVHPILVRQYKIVQEIVSAAFGQMPPQLTCFTGFLFATYLKSGFHLFNIEADGKGEVVEAVHCAIGSGQKTRQALLRRLRNQDWTLRVAEVVAYRTMNDAIHVEPSGIGEPIRLARLYLKDKKPAIERIENDELSAIRDAARAWTETEAEVLKDLQPKLPVGGSSVLSAQTA